VTQREHEVAVVTGASGGLGRAVAHAFARRGARVALLARGEEGLRDAAREVERMGEAVLSRWGVTSLGTP
jgi:NADP-dependent 3-hydroxy acid dehydrogenase YdfG